LLPGIDGRAAQFRWCVPGLRDAGITHTVEVIEWGNGPFRNMKNLTDLPANRAHARSIAERIAAYQRAHPDEPITLIGYSGGGGLALLVAEALPDDVLLDRIILIAAAISPDYDLSMAISRARRGLVNFYSSRDAFVLGAGTRTFGTIDRRYTESAGYVGFTDAEGGLRCRAGLTQIPWIQDWCKLGHDGGHIGWLARAWSREVLAAIIQNDVPAPE
jgi:pimeloyl-ACP methyl ester carboxylesterase